MYNRVYLIILYYGIGEDYRIFPGLVCVFRRIFCFYFQFTPSFTRDVGGDGGRVKIRFGPRWDQPPTLLLESVENSSLLPNVNLLWKQIPLEEYIVWFAAQCLWLPFPIIVSAMWSDDACAGYPDTKKISALEAFIFLPLPPLLIIDVLSLTMFLYSLQRSQWRWRNTLNCCFLQNVEIKDTIVGWERRRYSEAAKHDLRVFSRRRKSLCACANSHTRMHVLKLMRKNNASGSFSKPI